LAHRDRGYDSTHRTRLIKRKSAEAQRTSARIAKRRNYFFFLVAFFTAFFTAFLTFFLAAMGLPPSMLIRSRPVLR
jgi:hypothetical protein